LPIEPLIFPEFEKEFFMAAKAKGGGNKSTKPATKGEVLSQLADATGLSRKQVSSVLDQLGEMITKSLRKGGPGVFGLPGLLRFKVIDKPAQPERPGTNPFTGEPTIFKAKPARRVVKVAPLKALKSMV
jgi:nucleoid DNA-binding protein